MLTFYAAFLFTPELPENWTDTKETLLEGMAFNVKYLGMTLVGQPKGEDMASAAIRRIVAMVSDSRSTGMGAMREREGGGFLDLARRSADRWKTFWPRGAT